MVYLSHYEEYPIYEPAEGGYYYAGNSLVKSERMSERQAKKKLAEIWKNVQKENELLPSVERWVMSNDKRGVYKSSRYIGEGESIIIERHKGSEERGWEPYA